MASLDVAGQWQNLFSAITMTMHPLKNDESDNSDPDVTRAGFDGGGGGGYDGSMRERITKLEAVAADAMKRFDGIDARFDRVEARLDRVEARLDGVEARLDRVEARLDRVEARLDTLSQQLHDYRIETKHDIDNAVRWIVGVILAVSMAAITIVTFVLNHATPRTMPPTQQLQPIIIYASVPPGTQARSTAPAQP